MLRNLKMHFNSGETNHSRRRGWLSVFLPVMLCSVPAFSQDSISLAIKTVTAEKLDKTPAIDGLPDPGIWDKLPLATGYIQYHPYNAIKSVFETETRFGYNETGFYVGTFMHDPHPDSIAAELGQRDQLDDLNADFITVDILPYNDGLTMFEFKITAAGQQGDKKYSAAGMDPSWDAVWESAVALHDSGWMAELWIPYSALRFPRTEVQEWGINIWRNLNRRREMSTWSWVPNDRQEIFMFYGILRGMEGIKPPLRLSLTPYLGAYLEKQPGQERWNNFIRGGMDLKYGISQSHTLDMELVPDFGQVQSDDIILNLTPFEIRYDERRQFFTEGTELFQKSDIFYSRRVGSFPEGYGAAYDSLRATEQMTSNPELTQVINATKISGRNASGLGIGVFNGMTTNTWATARDTLTGATRRIATQPFTNYNVLVVDQNLKNNSYVSLINTNYWTPDRKYIANVTGTETKLVNRENTFAFKGLLNVSQIFRESDNPLLGYTSLLNIYRPGGIIRYSFSTEILDDGYDPNDMGYLERNNEIRNEGGISYNINQPVWRILKSTTALEVNYDTRYQPYSLITVELELDNSTTWRNFWNYEVGISYRPLGFYDYYEPRAEGWYYHRPPSWALWGGLKSDTRKKVAAGAESGVVYHPENSRLEYALILEPRYRISNRLTTSLTTQYSRMKNDYGWVKTETGNLTAPVITFGRRDVAAVDNILEARYVFTTAISLNLRARHYWSAVEYLDYYRLKDDGSLAPADNTINSDIDFNAFNLDLQILWFFAPGSQMSLLWKNNILTMGNVPAENYFRAFEETLEAAGTNSISVRVLYYLDYAIVKKAFRRRDAR